MKHVIEEKDMQIYQFHDHLPSNITESSKLGRPTVIDIDNQCIKTLLYRSCLLIREQAISKNKDTDDINLNKTHFVNNGIPNLFNKISYSINSVEIDYVGEPGLTTIIKGLSSFSKDL